MTIEIRGTYNRVERTLRLDAITITGSQEIRDYLAVHVPAAMLAQPMAHADAFCETLRPLFGDTLWRSDVAPVADVPAPVESSVADVSAEVEASQSATADVTEAEPPIEDTPRRSRRRP